MLTIHYSSRKVESLHIPKNTIWEKKTIQNVKQKVTKPLYLSDSRCYFRTTLYRIFFLFDFFTRIFVRTTSLWHLLNFCTVKCFNFPYESRYFVDFKNGVEFQNISIAPSFFLSFFHSLIYRENYYSRESYPHSGVDQHYKNLFNKLIYAFSFSESSLD